MDLPPDEAPPPSRSELIRTALWEIAIGFSAVVVVIVVIGLPKGMWRLVAKPFTLEFLTQITSMALLILLGAMCLAFFEYRAGMKKRRTWEHRQLWGRDPPDQPY